MPRESATSNAASPPARRTTRKRGARGNLRKAQEIDHVVVEDMFQLNLPDTVDVVSNSNEAAAAAADRKAGEGCYVSAIVNNRRYYGVLVDQASLQSASQLFFEDEASGLNLNRKMNHLKQQQQQRQSSSVTAPLHDGDVVFPMDDGETGTFEKDRKRPRPDPVTSVSSNNNPDAMRMQTSSSSADAANNNEPRPVQKFRYVDPVRSGAQAGPGYRILLATYADVHAAAEDSPDPTRFQQIETACQGGGNFVGDRFYQYEVKSLNLEINQSEKKVDNTLRMSMGFQTFLQNTELPGWFPLANLHGKQPTKLLSMLNMKKDNNGKVVWDDKPYVEKAPPASREALIPMEPRSRFRVCVVGGGIAGLSCCLELFRIAERDRIDVEVVLLEGRSRLGGRLWTDQDTFKDRDGESFPVDLGASWIHGITMNPLAVLAKEAGLDFVTTSEDVKMFQSDMKEIDADKDDRAGKLFDELLDIAANDCWIATDGASSRTSQAAIRWYASELGGNTANQVPSASRPLSHRRSDDISVDHAVGKAIMKSKHSQFAALCEEERRMLVWNLKNIEYALGANIDDLSMKFWDIDERHAFEGDHVLLRQGYSTVVDNLHSKLKQRGDRFKLSLNFAVGRLEYNRKTSTQTYTNAHARSQAFIKLSDVCLISSKEGDRSIKSDFVVSAVPLGVLKASVKEKSERGIAFAPKLPFVKRDAIEAVGFGLLNKVYMQFPHSFWTATSILGSNQTQFGNASGINAHHYMFLDIGKTLGSKESAPSVLVSLISGREAAHCEKLTEKELVAEVMETLRTIFSTIDVPEPTAFKTTKWGSDPFSRGSYTFLTPGTTDQDFETLQSPVNGNGDSIVLEGAETMRLFFAGEHTTALHPSMAHGAMLSGLRAAKEVMDSMSVNLTTEDEYDRLIPMSLFRHMNPKRVLRCSLCQLCGTTIREGKLLAFQKGSRQVLCHTNCAENSPEVEVFEGKWKDALVAINRSRSLTCSGCKQTGATIGCVNCERSYHFSCAEDTGWRFDIDSKEFYCDLHRSLQIEDCRRVSLDFYRSKTGTNNLHCELCDGAAVGKDGDLGETLAHLCLSKSIGQSRMVVVHESCVRYTSILDIGEDLMSKIGKEFKNVRSAINQSETCSHCNKKGATIRCHQPSCLQRLHYPCARKSGWNFKKQGVKFLCSGHRQHRVDVAANSMVLKSSDSGAIASFQHNLFSSLAEGVEGEGVGRSKYTNGVASLHSPTEPDILSVYSSDEENFQGFEYNHVDRAGMANLPAAKIHLAPPSTVGGRKGNLRLARLARSTVDEPWDVDLYASSEKGSALRTVSIASARFDPVDPLYNGDILQAINGVPIGSPLLNTLQKVFTFINQEIEMILEVRYPKKATTQ